MSGSIKTKVEYSKEDLEKESLDLLEKLFGSDIFDTILEQEAIKTKHVLNPPKDGSNYHWFFNMELKQLQRFHKDIPVEIVSSYNEDKYVCHVNGFNYTISKNLIKEPLEN